jgi:hypothetical protein
MSASAGQKALPLKLKWREAAFKDWRAPCPLGRISLGAFTLQIFAEG